MKKGLMRIIATLVVVAVSITAFNLTAFAAETLKTPEVSISTNSDIDDPVIKLSWKEIGGANSYYIYRGDDKKGKLKLVSKTSKLSYKDKDVKLDKTYYYKVRACKVVDGKIKAKSNYSKIVKTAIADLYAPAPLSEASTDSKIRVNVSTSVGATRYYYYCSTSKNSGYKCIGYSDDNYYTFTNLESSTTYYYKARAAKEIDGKIYKSAYSPYVGSCKTKSKDGEYIVDFKKVTNGKELPSGSAITCLTMLFNHYGIDVDKMEMLEYVNYSDEFYYKDGELWGPDPESYFIGDPTKENNKYEVFMSNDYMHSFIDYFMQENGITNIMNVTMIDWIDGLDKGDIILVSVNSEDKIVFSNTLRWYTMDYAGKKCLHAAYKGTKYVILCGYTDKEYIFYNPQTDSYEKMAKNDAYFGEMAKLAKK